MKKIGFFLLLSLMLSACSAADDVPKKEQETETTEKQKPAEESVPVSSTPEEENDSGTTNEQQSDFSDAQMQTVEIPSIYDEHGNIAAAMTQEEYEQAAKEQGIVRFAVDDHPVRGVTSQNNQVTNITNFADVLIDIENNRAYQLPKEELADTYQLFLKTRADEFTAKPDSEYRTWEEATNLERSVMQLVPLLAPSLNDLGYLLENDMLDHPILPIIQNDFTNLGSPSTLFPGPQTGTDMILYDLLMAMQAMWRQLGTFEDPETNREEFEELYQNVRSETNNLIVRVNYTLTE